MNDDERDILNYYTVQNPEKVNIMYAVPKGNLLLCWSGSEKLPQISMYSDPSGRRNLYFVEY